MACEDPELVTLRVQWDAETDAGRECFARIVLAAGRRVLGRYLTGAYGLEGASRDDAVQSFAEFVLDKWTVARVSDLLRRASTLEDVERILVRRAKWWVEDRARRTLGGHLKRRVKDLPNSDSGTFEWVVRLQWMTLTGGSTTCREADSAVIATRIATDPMVRKLAADSIRFSSPQKVTFRESVKAVLREHAAARHILIVDVLLRVLGEVDTRPLLLRRSESRFPHLDRPDLHDAAAEVFEHLRRWHAPQLTAIPLRDRLDTLLDDGRDTDLSAVLLEALNAVGVDSQDGARVVELVQELFLETSDDS